MRPLLFNLGVGEELFDGMARHLDAEQGAVAVRSFPDGETYLRFDTRCSERHVIIACSLDRPDPKTVPILLASDTLRDLGAEKVGLIAPYLAYMRQDKSFHPGEGISARHYAGLLSNHFDWLVTVDPHLHRFTTLDEVYSIPTRVLHAAPALADWIRSNVPDPVLIGPDSESKQWVSEVAERAQAPYLVLEKIRSGDRQVQVSVPDIGSFRDRTPVLIDDIVSTGQTLVAAIQNLLELGTPSPVSAAVHGVFAEGALAALREAGAADIITSNTITHETNRVDLSELLASGAAELASEQRES